MHTTTAKYYKRVQANIMHGKSTLNRIFKIGTKFPKDLTVFSINIITAYLMAAKLYNFLRFLIEAVKYSIIFIISIQISLLSYLLI